MRRIYDRPIDEFLDQQVRMVRAKAALDAPAIQAVLAETPPIELVPGNRYRIRTIGGPAEFQPVHVREVETGKEHHLDMPFVVDPQWVEPEGTYLGRVPPGSPFQNLLWLRLDDGTTALLADMDVLTCDDVYGQDQA